MICSWYLKESSRSFSHRTSDLEKTDGYKINSCLQYKSTRLLAGEYFFSVSLSSEQNFRKGNQEGLLDASNCMYAYHKKDFVSIVRDYDKIMYKDTVLPAKSDSGVMSCHH